MSKIKYEEDILDWFYQLVEDTIIANRENKIIIFSTRKLTLFDSQIDSENWGTGWSAQECENCGWDNK